MDITIMFKKIYIEITNNCNLKCLGCMQSCDRITNPYYMSIKEL